MLGSIRSPKIAAKEREQSWYRYYAGYPEAFVDDLLALFECQGGDRILDPWSGSGTTIAAAVRKGLVGIGIDLSPVLFLVARARVAPADEVQAFEERVTAALKKVPAWLGAAELADPICAFLSPLNAAVFRTIQARLSCPLELRDGGTAVHKSTYAQALDAVLCFRVARRVARLDRMSNPTWYRTRDANPPRLTKSDLIRFFGVEFAAMSARLRARRPSPNGVPLLFCGSARNAAAVVKEPVSFVLGSPPYLTRIDYVVSMWPEFSVLKYDVLTDPERYRNGMTGTPLTKTCSEHGVRLPHSVVETLDRIRNHQSKASSTYYYRFYLQYFADFSETFPEVTRVTTDRAKMALVLQGSYYKDLFIDLPSLAADVAESAGWSVVRRESFTSKHDIARVNGRARLYNRSRASHEEVVVFHRS